MSVAVARLPGAAALMSVAIVGMPCGYVAAEVGGSAGLLALLVVATALAGIADIGGG